MFRKVQFKKRDSVLIKYSRTWYGWDTKYNKLIKNIYITLFLPKLFFYRNVFFSTKTPLDVLFF